MKKEKRKLIMLTMVLALFICSCGKNDYRSTKENMDNLSSDVKTEVMNESELDKVIAQFFYSNPYTAEENFMSHMKSNNSHQGEWLGIEEKGDYSCIFDGNLSLNGVRECFYKCPKENLIECMILFDNTQDAQTIAEKLFNDAAPLYTRTKIKNNNLNFGLVYDDKGYCNAGISVVELDNDMLKKIGSTGNGKAAVTIGIDLT